MSSKFAKQYQVPPEFPEILKDFAREVLRRQPTNVNEFAAKYFDCLASGLPADSQGRSMETGGSSTDEPDLSRDEVKAMIQDLFRHYDGDGNCYLDPDEFKRLMKDMQTRLDFPPDEIYRFLAEADMNADGMVEYEEFIPLALQIIQGMYAKKRLEQHMQDVSQQSADLLVHGMSRDEFNEIVESIFRKIDTDSSGQLSKQEFVAALTSMELGLTRREINTIMFQIDQDKDGNISYSEFMPFAFDLLQKLTSMRLLETQVENDEFALYLSDLFKAKDTDMAGALAVDEVRDVLHQAMLGLSRMQIYTVISEAEVNSDGAIMYASFIPRAVGLIRSMLSFENSIVGKNKGSTPEQEEEYYTAMDQMFETGSSVQIKVFVAQLQSCGLLSDKELTAVQHLLRAQMNDGSEEKADKLKTEVWALMKNMRQNA